MAYLGLLLFRNGGAFGAGKNGKRTEVNKIHSAKGVIDGENHNDGDQRRPDAEGCDKRENHGRTDLSRKWVTPCDGLLGLRSGGFLGKCSYTMRPPDYKLDASCHWSSRPRRAAMLTGVGMMLVHLSELLATISFTSF